MFRLILSFLLAASYCEARTFVGQTQIRSAPGAQSAGSLLEVNTTVLGAIPAPRMTTAQKNALSNLTDGLQVYDTTLHVPSWYNGSVWTVPILNALTSAHLFVGSAGNVPTDTAVTGDVAISNTGVTSIVGSNLNFAGNAVKENGRNLVVGGANGTTSMAILAGYVDSAGHSPGVGNSRGIGWTCVRNSIGDYTISFNTNFSDPPFITANGALVNGLGSAVVGFVTDATVSAVEVVTRVPSTNALVDHDFIFQVIGQR